LMRNQQKARKITPPSQPRRFDHSPLSAGKRGMNAGAIWRKASKQVEGAGKGIFLARNTKTKKGAGTKGAPRGGKVGKTCYKKSSRKDRNLHADKP